MKTFNTTHLKEYDNHRLLACFYDNETDTHSFIALHKGHNGSPCFGATRMWKYANQDEAINDALRLSKLMSYKNALAKTGYGGAKGVIFADNPTGDQRKKIITNYTKWVNTLGGTFVTGADVGISEEDVRHMKKTSEHIVGLSIDPVKYTVDGLMNSLRFGLKEAFGSSSLSGHTFAIQGVGKTGSGLVKKLQNKAKHIYIADIDKDKMIQAAQNRKNITMVDPDKIYAQRVDVFCPCALNGILNETTVEALKARIIVGSANNQLVHSDIGQQLHTKGILYLPDYVVNAGGLISVVNEYDNEQGKASEINERVDRIKETLQDILSISKKKNISMNDAADMLAHDMTNNAS